MQIERIFPDATSLTVEQKRHLVSCENPESAFYGIVGNRAAKEQVELIAFEAIGRSNHRVSDLHLAWIGPPGVGKTAMAKAFAKTLTLPFIEVSPQVKNVTDLFDEMQRVLSRHQCYHPVTKAVADMRMTVQADGGYFAPSCTVFIDEVHQLDTVVEQALLRATEPSTHILESKNMRLDTRAIQWQIATTDRGKLADAFDTRFVKIELLPYTREEISQIVRTHNTDIPVAACDRISNYYFLVTREALAAANLVRMDRNMHGCSWEEAVERVRIRDGIDEYGLSRKRLSVLKALGGGKKSLSSLSQFAGCKAEELENFVLPPMLIAGNGIEPLVEVGAGGRYITRAGLRELDKRGIHHSGTNALPRWAA